MFVKEGKTFLFVFVFFSGPTCRVWIKMVRFVDGLLVIVVGGCIKVLEGIYTTINVVGG